MIDLKYNINFFNRLVSNIDREGIMELLDHLEDCGYFEAPASGGHHLAEKGGLLQHSLNVTRIALTIYDKLETDNLPVDSIVICGLFHDLGKAEYYNKMNYVENILKSGKQSTAKPFKTNKDKLNIPHEMASIHILSKFIELTEDETFAILYHNGLYTPTGYTLKGNERPLQMIIHFADMWASRVVESDGFEPMNNLF